MNRKALISQIRSKKTFLCVGLDPDSERLPPHIPRNADGLFEFCKTIIDHTKEHCVAYKPNWAFFEAFGLEGYSALKKVLDYIPDTHFKMADAKRGDIGNTARKYATSTFEYFGADGITVAPYMGRDSIEPFLVEGKWVVLLALTSNKGSQDFQHFANSQGKKLYEKVLETTKEWLSPENGMYVVGATHPEEFKNIRAIVPEHFLLVPGVGAQGGSLEKVCEFGLNEDIGLLINSSRGVIYSSTGEDYGKAAGESAEEIHNEMKSWV